MTAVAPKKPVRDHAFWTAVRAAYAAGVSVERCCALFGIGRSTLMAKAREQGWLRRDVARSAEQALVASIAAEVPGAEEALRLTDAAAPADISPPDAASIAASALAAAYTAIKRAAEAATRADDAAADVAVKLGERFARAASILGRMAVASAASEQDDPQARREEILRRIDQALEGGRTARRVEVEALKARGVDPREAWVWDAGDGDWVWDPGGAIARATTPRGPANEQEAPVD